MKSRIAIFEGYAAPFRGGKFSAPIFDNPRVPALGRRGYYVPERNESVTDSRRPYRKGYKVKAKRNTPAMKRAVKKFAKCARKCAKRRGARSSFPSCMRVCVRSKRKSSKR